MPKKQKSALLLTVGTAIALTAGGATAFWALRQRGTVGGGGSGHMAIVPDNALVAFSVSTSERQWQQVRSLGTPETQTQFNTQLAQWRDRLLSDSGLDYQQDIQPWIGEDVTIALLAPTATVPLPDESESAEPDPESPDEDANTDGSAGVSEEPFIEPADGADASDDAPASDEPTESDSALSDAPEVDPELIDPTQEQSPILIAPIADPIKAQARLGSLLGEEGAATTQDYKGAEVYALPEEFFFKFATVFDQKTLVLTTDEPTLEQVIDTQQGEASVVDTPGYRQALQKVEIPQSFLQIYLNSDAAATLAAANTVQAAPPQGLASLEDGQGVAASVVIDEGGFALKGISWLKPDAETPYQRGKTAGKVLEQLPQDTLMMVTASNFNQLWQAIDRQSTEGVKGPLNTESIRSGFKALTGLDIDDDLVSWMTGDFAMALVTAPKAEDATPAAGLVMMAESGDRPAAEKTFTQLEEALRSRYRFQVTPSNVKGVEVTSWISPFGALNFTRGWLEGDTSFVAIGNIAENLIPKPSTSLASNPVFQQVTRTDLNTVNGYFFVNIEAILGAKSALPIPPLPPSQAATVGSIQAIGVATSIQDEKTARFDVSVMMPSLGNPGTLPDVSTLEDEPEEGTEEESPDGESE